MLYFLYGSIAMTLWFWGKALHHIGFRVCPAPLWCRVKSWGVWLINLSSIFEDAQFIGFREAKRRSSWNKK